jgi:protein-S-isoprenylcysteine O-methyltransferase Ste14
MGIEMNQHTSANSTRETPELTHAVRKRLVQVVMTFILLAALLFLSAGTLKWPAAWAYLGAYLGILAVNALVLLPRHSEMVAERSEIKEDAKGWDRVLGTVIGVLTLAMLIVSGLDRRFGWSSQYGLAIHLVGLALAALGMLLFTWAMASNRFFSRAVRIQADRGHTVETSGPYQFVRHPGYVGMIASLLGTPLALGSLWALIPAGLAAGGYVVRTALEDRTLLQELEGYQGYARQVRYRLLPGMW